MASASSATSSRTRPTRRKEPAVSRPGPAGGDLAGRWLSKFLTSHLAAERDLSPQTIASYRDAIRLLLTWFRDVQGTPPEKLRLADIDRTRVLAFLDWLQAERGNSRRPGTSAWPSSGRLPPLHDHGDEAGPSSSARPPRSSAVQAQKPPPARWVPHRRRGQGPPGRPDPGDAGAGCGDMGPCCPALRHRRPRPGISAT